MMPPTPSFLDPKPYLREIAIRRDAVPSFDHYPFSLPVLRGLTSLPFHPDITFLVGENGTGKSTLLEAIAGLLGYNREGGNRNFNFFTRETHSDLDQALRLSMGAKKPADGFFLRAESFYNVASYVDDLDYAAYYGGKSLHVQSHGESFLALLTNRFKGHGLYLMDEPEAALSPARQLSALAVIHDLVKKDSQFIIATHSPILMAYPRAKILSLSADGIHEVSYEETDHYRVTRDFLERRDLMLKVLLAASDPAADQGTG